MKQLVVCGAFPLGIHTFIMREVATVARLGSTVTVVAPSPGDDAGQEFFQCLDGHDAVNVHYESVTKSRIPSLELTRLNAQIVAAADFPRFGKKLGMQRALSLSRLWRKLRGENIEIIHAHFVGWAFEMGIPLSRLLGVPLTVTCHNTFGQLKHSDPAVLSRLQHDAMTIATVSHATRDYWARLTGSDSRLEVIPNGIMVDEFGRRDAASDGVFRVASIARLTREKRIGDALRVISELANRGINVQYDVFGDGPMMQALREDVKTLGLSSRVTLHGMTQHSTIRHALSRCSLFIHPSEDESFGVAVAEAMAAGLPVVVARSGGVSDVVEDGVSGFLVDPGAIEQFVDCVIRLHESSQLRETIGATARSRIERDLSWTRHMDMMLEMWGRAIRSHRKNSSATPIGAAS